VKVIEDFDVFNLIPLQGLGVDEKNRIAVS